MRWSNLLPVIGALTLLSACAGGPREAIDKGNQLAQSGATEDGLNVLLEARVEAPESVELLFAIAGAEAALGDRLLEQHDLEGARSRFMDARATFGRCANAPHLAGGAAYNAATCLLRLDNVLERGKDYAGRVENLKAAVAALEAVVSAYPDQPRAKKNLDCARYRLALLLQSPPSESENQDGNGQEDEPDPASGVAGASTQLPGATVEVESGSVVVLHTTPRVEAAP